MLSRQHTHARGRVGATLIELLVGMALTAVVLGAASSTLLRQGHDANAHQSRVRSESQLRAALGEMQVALEGLSTAAGDLAAAQARDTAIQLRTVVGSAVACDSAVGLVTLATDDTSENRAGGLASAPRAGDTLWWHPPGAPGWISRRIASVSGGTGACAYAGASVQALLRLGLASPDTFSKGVPLRITRQARYSFYRAGDGSWQLGIAEWSEVLHAFAPPQPVAGPFTIAAAGGIRTGFRYFDVGGVELHDTGQGVDVTRVSRVRVTIVAPRESECRLDGRPAPRLARCRARPWDVIARGMALLVALVLLALSAALAAATFSAAHAMRRAALTALASVRVETGVRRAFGDVLVTLERSVRYPPGGSCGSRTLHPEPVDAGPPLERRARVAHVADGLYAVTVELFAFTPATAGGAASGASLGSSGRPRRQRLHPTPCRRSCARRS